MDCQRAEELFSDHLEGTLHEILRSELDTHLAGCAECRGLRSAFAEVVGALHAVPEFEPPVGLAERVADAARRRAPSLPAPQPLVLRPAFAIPSWVQAAAAGFALIALGTLLLIVGPEAPTRAAERMVGRTVSAGNVLRERKDRIVEDVRILGVVLTTAFEGRLERVNERVEDYRRLLERRRGAEPGDTKRGSEAFPFPVRLAAGFRTGTGPDS
jgi:hypothetical protein